MIVFILEWRLIGGGGNDSGWIVDGVYSNEALAFESSNAGNEIGSTPFRFEVANDFCGDRRWVSNLVDGERFRVREFKVQTP